MPGPPEKIRRTVASSDAESCRGDPSSVEFFHKVGLDYVSCSPFRVPIARLAAAQAAIKEEAEKEAEPKKAFKIDLDIDIDKEDIEKKVEAAKAALKDATDKISAATVDARAELKDVLSAGFKSLLAGWEEAKKTFGEERKDK